MAVYDADRPLIVMRTAARSAALMTLPWAKRQVYFTDPGPARGRNTGATARLNAERLTTRRIGEIVERLRVPRAVSHQYDFRGRLSAADARAAAFGASRWACKVAVLRAANLERSKFLTSTVT